MVAARALVAFQRGEDTVDGMAGAVLVADAIDCLRDIRGFVKGLEKGLSKRK